MESQNKVMTVSYGTFSCTLDGFDDPFTTMQLVSEYFRKLSSEDRYFGGEPLQPDHNALHRIAQDANPYKVDAEVTDTGVTLRKADIVDAPQPKAEIVSNAPAPEKAPIEEEAAPLFASKRAAPQPVAEIVEDIAEEDAVEEDTIDEDIASFVEAAMLSSRRGSLESGETESEKSAAELLAEEDDSDDTDQSAELEAIKAQIKEDVKSVEDAPAADEKAPEDKAAVHAGTNTDDIQREEEALERLLETTNTKMDNPAHARKSNALERLKAAVAATEAERRLRSDPEKTQRPKVQDLGSPAEFKSRMGDLRRGHEEVVKISRPKSKKTGERARGAFATLILGNDQRVGSNDAAEAAAAGKKLGADGQQTAAQTPIERAKPALKIVRPETQDTDNAVRGTIKKSGFAGFAEKIGANSLHELLEASAAYLAIVEDEPRFSQDRILENLGDYLSKNDVSNEAASRSLNRLMRDGRILRVKQDSYTISKSAKHGFKDRMAG